MLNGILTNVTRWRFVFYFTVSNNRRGNSADPTSQIMRSWSFWKEQSISITRTYACVRAVTANLDISSNATSVSPFSRKKPRSSASSSTLSKYSVTLQRFSTLAKAA
ncbi:hypothetical protein M413DRAFT_165491 [Hebeloma cylindrosporum]|uniref:Uncharacterized protein n=1 Tax=Hebeloma cylindrosporum TaxID=76867 RepID=A0A0C3CAM4_HEBCY|nr:hypothetical protein M413DRAFT_165491 [Hebeloma cylindrosporum h7]